ncbi:unnamed protein product [Linum tenue]|uniref:Uncharacterized protein n=1 Tax=Linum tenue TaxID=586396 RepID=A0AAV0S0Z3_9ROSI|nr:unnamed protein product [Linum tenue]
MGQAFRRASGRIRVPDPSPKVVVDRRPPESAAEKVVEVSRRTTPKLDNQDTLGAADNPSFDNENPLEEKDPQFDAMLNQMVGRIKTKPGGKPEMGEASIVQSPNKPLPKLRNTTPDAASKYEERAVPPGTLNVAQLRHILKLQAGKGEGDNLKAPVDAHQIAQQFRLEVEQVKKFLQFVSLPAEDSMKKEKDVE